MIEFFSEYIKAGDETIPLAHLRKLAQHAHENVRRRVAENGKCPPELLEILAGDLHPEVKIAVAEHANTPLFILERLSLDEHPDVRYAIAEHHRMPRNILEKLMDDENPYVKHRAAKTLRRLDCGKVTSRWFGKADKEGKAGSG